MRRILVLLFLIVLEPACVQGSDARSATQSVPSQGTFLFEGWAGPPIKVWYQTPARVAPTTPIVFVMHGVRRDADRYLAEWAPIAALNGFIVVVPEFSETDFPGSLGYNAGFLQEKDGTNRPPSRWSFAAIEPLFDDVKARTGSQAPRYTLYGHSAGGQFVHRYVLLMPEARLDRAIAANAGWYTMPDLGADYPYGLAATPADETSLKQALGRPLTILLGTADTDVNDPNLRRTPEANAQGPHRYARGVNFHRHGQTTAQQIDVLFGWQLQEVRGVGHKNGEMAVAAAPLIAN